MGGGGGVVGGLRIGVTSHAKHPAGCEASSLPLSDTWLLCDRFRVCVCVCLCVYVCVYVCLCVSHYLLLLRMNSKYMSRGRALTQDVFGHDKISHRRIYCLTSH
jgi:hypothetical protein